MSIYALSDLHLYKSIKDKPMDIFGAEWDNHMEKLEEGCKILKKPFSADELKAGVVLRRGKESFQKVVLKE